MFNLLRGFVIGLLVGGMVLLVQHLLATNKPRPAAEEVAALVVRDPADAPRHDIVFTPGHPDASAAAKTDGDAGAAPTAPAQTAPSAPTAAPATPQPQAPAVPSATAAPASNATAAPARHATRPMAVSYRLGDDGPETACFSLDRGAPPALHPLEDRIYFILSGVEHWEGLAMPFPGGRLIRAIRTHLHEETKQLKVVLDLAPGGRLGWNRTFDPTARILCVTVFEK